MNKYFKQDSFSVSRRGFVAGGAGLTFAFTFSGLLSGRPEAFASASGAADKTIGGWVTITPDDKIVIAAPIAEMGQGVMTAIPMIVAEELDADWAKVEPIVPPQVPKLYGNPQLGGAVYVVASRTVDGFWDKARIHGAQARCVLMQVAAEKWGVPVAEVTTEPSVVVHKASNRRMSYGEIAKFATVPAELPNIDKADLKKPSEYRIIGQDKPRFDIPSKVDGSAKYGADVSVPGMVYATLLRSPVEGGEPDAVDEAAALKIPGVTQTVKLRDAVAIVGTSAHAVFGGRDALKVTWKGGRTAGFDSVKALDEYGARARKLDEKGLPYRSEGNAEGAIGSAGKVVSAEYRMDYVYHAQMEPVNAVVSVNEAGDGAEVWMGTQGQTIMAGALAGFLKTDAKNIKVHQQYLGGGFGRRAYADAVIYGAAISRAVKKPVKMMFTREQDVQAAMMRPQMAQYLQAGLDANGKVVGWRHRIVAEATIGLTQPARLEAAKGLDPLTLEGAEHRYEIENLLVEYLRENRGTALAAWRAIGSGCNKFAIECFIDEVARQQNKDPIEYRLAMMQKHPRGRRVIEAVAKMANWGSKPAEGRALGFAYADIWRTPTAGIAEISLSRDTGVIRVHRFWNVVNPGIVINPDVVVQQSESNVVWGVSSALKERISFADGAIEQSNFHDYEVLRMSETPEIITEVIATEDNPTGIGEIVFPLVAPAIANAFAALTGKHVRHTPFTPERVKEALKA
jgi:isoquinoline 1-oxidoreductase subunit beta